ncbi:MAG: hypothetical protein ACTSQE_07340 [Candidatus Heimdallarchaeaceae archaeon]
MAATVLIRRLTGSGPTATDITGINTRANAEDAHTTAGTSNPVRIPAAGTNYSYWVVTRLDATVTPTGTINNLKWYSDGANGFGTGVTCKGNTATGYVQATGTAGETGDILNTTNYATLAGAPVDVFTHTSASPKSVTGSVSNPTTGEFGDRFVYQIEVDSTASPGATGSETFTYRYDET